MLGSKTIDYQELPEKDEFCESMAEERLKFTKPSRAVLAGLLVISIAGNLLAIVFFAFNSSSPAGSLTKYAQIPMVLVPQPGGKSGYIDENETLADLKWDTLNTDPATVVLSDEFVSRHNLPTAARFPWDESKGIYYLEGFHDVHCLKLIRRSISDFRRQQQQSVPKHHIDHCLDALRQHVMCVASDLPIPATKGAPADRAGPAKECRDWEELTRWATHPERDACWRMIDEYKTTKHDIEKFAFCDKDSVNYPSMRQYFDTNGHQDPWS